MGKQLGWVWFGGLRPFIFYNTKPFFEVLDPKSDSMLVQFPSSHLSYLPNTNIINDNIVDNGIYQNAYYFENKIYYVPFNPRLDPESNVGGILGVHAINESYSRVLMSIEDLTGTNPPIDSFYFASSAITSDGFIYYIPSVSRRDATEEGEFPWFFGVINTKTNVLTIKDLGLIQILPPRSSLGSTIAPNYNFSITLEDKIYSFPLLTQLAEPYDPEFEITYGFLIIDTKTDSLTTSTLGLTLTQQSLALSENAIFEEVFSDGVILNNKIYSLIVKYVSNYSLSFVASTVSVTVFSIDSNSNLTSSGFVSIPFGGIEDSWSVLQIHQEGNIIICGEGDQLYIVKNAKAKFEGATVPSGVYPQDTIYAININTGEVRTISLSVGVMGVFDAIAFEGRIYLSCSGFFRGSIYGQYPVIGYPNSSSLSGLFVVDTANGNVTKISNDFSRKSFPVLVTGSIDI